MDHKLVCCSQLVEPCPCWARPGLTCTLQESRCRGALASVPLSLCPSLGTHSSDHIPQALAVGLAEMLAGHWSLHGDEHRLLPALAPRPGIQRPQA